MTEVAFTANSSGVDRLLHDQRGPMGQYLTRIGNRAVSAAKPRANVDTGLMRSRIEFRLEGGGSSALVGILAARTDYAQYVHRDNPFLTDAVNDVLA